QRLWSREDAAAAARQACRLVDVVISTSEDARDLFGAGGGPEAAVAQLSADLGVETVVLTLGSEGALALSGGKLYQRPGHLVDTIDRVGAGDAFAAGLIWGLLEG